MHDGLISSLSFDRSSGILCGVESANGGEGVRCEKEKKNEKENAVRDARADKVHTYTIRVYNTTVARVHRGLAEYARVYARRRYRCLCFSRNSFHRTFPPCVPFYTPPKKTDRFRGIDIFL